MEIGTKVGANRVTVHGVATWIRGVFGLPPLPFRGGRVSPKMEHSSPSPLMFCCYSKTTLHSYGHAVLPRKR